MTRKVVYTEEIEILGNIDGTLVCQLRWRDHVWEQPLPRGFDRWPSVEMRSHLENHIIPLLRLDLLKAQHEALSDPASAGDDCIPLVVRDEDDIGRLNSAQAKRDRKGAKLTLLS